MPPAQIDEKTRKQISELRKLLQGVNAASEQAENQTEKAVGKPIGWETYKDMKATWILSSDKLPGAVQDDMKEVGDYVRQLREKSKSEPTPDEIVEEYVSRVSGKSFVAEGGTGNTSEERIVSIDLATEKSFPAPPVENSENEDVEKEPEPELPEAVLSKWDEALMGATKPEIKKPPLPAKVSSLAPSPVTTPVKKPVVVPKKPSPEKAQYMREAATPTITGRVVEGLPQKAVA